LSALIFWQAGMICSFRCDADCSYHDLGERHRRHDIGILIGPVSSPPEFSSLQLAAADQAGQQLSGAWIIRVASVGNN
jgi:hypothetical protein